MLVFISYNDIIYFDFLVTLIHEDSLMKKLFLISFAAVFVASLSGCTNNAYTGESQVSKTAMGAGAGAASGALVGQLIGHSTGATLIGAGIGTVVGGGIGLYMDHQESELRKQLEGTGVRVERDGKAIKLIMPGDITFDNDRAEIKPSFFDTLNSVAIVLNKYSKTTVKVAGYASKVGNEQHNQVLSEQRAQAVASFLINKSVASSRVVSVGYGSRFPVATNSTKQGQALNRRVEITIQQ